jgi:hypothetical protein
MQFVVQHCHRRDVLVFDIDVAVRLPNAKPEPERHTLYTSLYWYRRCSESAPVNLTCQRCIMIKHLVYLFGG